MARRRKLLVRRKGYKYYKPSIGKWVSVSPTEFYITDRGAPGRGPKVIKLRPGRMTQAAIELGYIKEGQRIGDIPMSQIPQFALDLAEYFGPKRAFKMFHAQVVLRKRTNHFGEKMKRKILNTVRYSYVGLEIEG